MRAYLPLRRLRHSHPAFPLAPSLHAGLRSARVRLRGPQAPFAWGVIATALVGCAAGNSSTSVYGSGDGGPEGAAADTGGDAAPDSTQIVFSNDGASGHDANAADAAAEADAAASEAGGPKQTCVHNTDCTAPNLCTGDNGLACLGGFCVATNMPMNCDDGVPCTTDVCNASTNACTHTPDNAACPTGELCDPVMNCVAMLACMPGDGVCDRLDTTACAGLWSCSAATMFCVHDPVPCPARANATTACAAAPFDGGVPADAGMSADGGDVSAECSWTCQTGYVDTNGDLEAPVGQPSNGCECQATNPVDLPDLSFADTNCDGIDGTIADAVFVDTATGVDSNPGTIALPKKTIQAGINTASIEASPSGFPSPLKDVYVSKGTYDEHLTMVNGVSVYGGYDASSKWSRALTNTTLVASPTNVAVDASELTLPFTIQLLSLSSQTASGSASNGGGASSYGVRVLNCSGGATVAACDITVGAGVGITATAAGGANGANGGNGGNAGGTGGGAAGASACGAGGGAGGQGVNGVTAGFAGGNGATPSGGGLGAVGGGAGAIGYCSSTSARDGGNGGGPVSVGAAGPSGANAPAGATVGSFDSTGNYLPPAGNPGFGDGHAGGGGGGGGSGGGTATGGSFPDELDCDNVSSGGGGGGGAGGCGGGYGSGGAGGGGSFAFVVVASTLRSSGNTLNTGRGGKGGNGGNGGGGGSAGLAGAGANGQTGGDDDNYGGNGAAGTPGGNGGYGGGGGGGAGGPSACFGYTGTAPISSSDTCNNSGGGSGGNGGGNNGGVPTDGVTGPTGTVNVL